MSSRLPLGKNGLAVGESAKHDHVIRAVTGDGNPNPVTVTLSTNNGVEGALTPTLYNWTKTATGYLTSGSCGNNLYHNNISPCLCAYLWRRKS